MAGKPIWKFSNEYFSKSPLLKSSYIIKWIPTKKSLFLTRNILVRKRLFFGLDPYYNIQNFSKEDPRTIVIRKFKKKGSLPIIHIFKDSTKHYLCFNVKFIAKIQCRWPHSLPLQARVAGYRHLGSCMEPVPPDQRSDFALG